MSSCFSRCLRVPIAMRRFYEQSLWIPQKFFVYESGLAPRAAKLEDDGFGPERKCMLDLLHGQLLHENEKYEDAVAEYERVLQRLSQDTGTLRKQVGKAFEEAGWKLAYAKGSSLGNQDAERAYLRAISCQETADSCRRLAR